MIVGTQQRLEGWEEEKEKKKRGKMCDKVLSGSVFKMTTWIVAFIFLASTVSSYSSEMYEKIHIS